MKFRFDFLFPCHYLYLLSVLFFISNSSIYGKTYFVNSVNGNDNNSGLSPSSAWKTIAKVNSYRFAGGDTISFKSGLRFSGAFLKLNSDYLTLNSFGIDERPVLDGLGKRNCVTMDSRSNIKFQDLKFVNGFPRDVELNGCFNITFDSCNVDSCAGTNIFNQNIYSGQGSNLIIRYSTISYAGQSTGGGHGIYIDGTGSTLLEFDTLISNKNDNIRIGYGYTGPFYTDKLIVRYCIIKYAGDENISDDGSRNSQFYYNVFENDTAGWSVNISLFEQNGYCPSRNEYYNNTFIIHDYGKDNAGFYIHTSDSIANIKIFNNIFYLAYPGRGWALFVEKQDLKDWQINYNLYYSKDGSRKHLWELNGYAISSLVNWKKLGFDKNGLFKDPLFENYKEGNYSLLMNSPAARKGKPNGTTRDIRGISVPETNPDIGAFQSQVQN